MKKEKWHEDQPVLKDDLERASDTKEAAIRERLIDSFNPGVLQKSQFLGEDSPFEIEQGPTAGLFVTVNTGVGFSPAGERIVIPAVAVYSASNLTQTADNGIGGTTLVPQSTGSQDIPVTNNTTNYIWVGYLETTDSAVFTLSEVTNQRLFTKRDDGFEIAVTTTNINPNSSRFILLGEVVTLSGAVTEISTSNEKESATSGVVVIPGTPYQITLTGGSNLHSDQNAIAAIPTIAGFSYVGSAPAVNQFTVNFKTGVVTFNSTNSGASVTINYEIVHVRRQYGFLRGERAGVELAIGGETAVYEKGTEVTSAEHINAIGSGSITEKNPHGLSPADIGLSGITDLGGVLASNGLTTPLGDVSSISSALSPGAVSAFVLQDNIVAIAPLVSGEFVNIGGTTVNSSDIPTQTLFNFVDVTLSPIPVGTYYIYVDKTTKTVQRALSAAPADSFPIASIYWDGAKLLLPITDLRKFGTSGRPNIRLETLLGLATGSATDNREHTLYYSSITGAFAVTSPTHAFTGLGSTTLTMDVGGSPETVTFPALPVNPTLTQTVAEINSQVSSVLAVKTSDNRVKLLSSDTLEITGGAAAPIIGFAVGQTDNESPSFVVSASNNAIDFKANAGPELNAILTSGTYAMGTSSSQPDTLCEEVKASLEAQDVGGVYTVTFNPYTLKVTIARSTGTLQILWATGTNTATAADALLGFTTADTAVAASVTSDSTTAAPAYIEANENIKEIRIEGSTSGVGVGGESMAAEIAYAYDNTPETNLISTTARMGNTSLTTTIGYGGGRIVSIQEEVS